MAATSAPKTISHEWAEGFVERWLAAVNSREPARVLALLTDDIVYDDSGWPQTMRGHAHVRELLVFMWRAFPDLAFEAGQPLIALDGSGAAFPWRGRGTNTGPLDPPGVPATGQPIEFEGADLHLAYREGKISRLHILFDMASVLRQIGLLPTSSAA